MPKAKKGGEASIGESNSPRNNLSEHTVTKGGGTRVLKFFAFSLDL